MFEIWNRKKGYFDGYYGRNQKLGGGWAYQEGYLAGRAARFAKNMQKKEMAK